MPRPSSTALMIAGGAGLVSSVTLLVTRPGKYGWAAAIGGLGAALLGAGYLTRGPKPFGFGLSQVEEHRKDGMSLKVWHDKDMELEKRVHLLQGLVAKSNKDPTVRKQALQITKRCPARDDACEAKAIFDWVAGNVRYTGDIGEHALWPGGPVEAIDTYQSALRTMEFEGGDCDDHNVLVSTLANQNGFPARFRITSNTGETWDHIYTVIGTPKLRPTRWIAMDTTLGRGRFNKHPRQAKHLDYPA